LAAKIHPAECRDTVDQCQPGTELAGLEPKTANEKRRLPLYDPIVEERHDRIGDQQPTERPVTPEPRPGLLLTHLRLRLLQVMIWAIPTRFPDRKPHDSRQREPG